MDSAEVGAHAPNLLYVRTWSQWMSPTPPIPESLWKTVPPDAHAALVAVFAALRCRVAELDQRVADLEGRLKLNSTNYAD